MSINNLQQILLLFTKELKKQNINYALGGSLLLHYEGINVSVNDIDLLIDEKDHNSLKEVLKNYQFNHIESNEIYQTNHFYSIKINDVHIDIMLGFKILSNNSIYEFPFNIAKTIIINQESINLSSIEEWLQAYQIMNRTDKVLLITNHLNFRINTKRLLIRKVQYEDKMAMLEYMSDEDTLYFESSAPFTFESIDNLLGEIVPSGTFFSVLLKKTKIQIGHLYFGIGSPAKFKEYNLGYIMNKKYHNQGYCSEASKAIIDYGFQHYDMHRVIAKCNPDNIASWKVMEKIGLIREGHLKERVCFKKDAFGNPIWWDEFIYGITKKDWLKKSV